MEHTELQFEIMEDIACGVPLTKVLEKLVKLVEGQIPGAACSVHLLDEDGLHLCLALAPNLPEAYNQKLARFPIGPRVGSCGTAAFRGECVLVADAREDELWADYRELALKFGVKACWSTPVLSRRLSSKDGTQRVLGTFAVYPNDYGLPDTAFLQLMQRAQHLACLAFETDRIKTTETLLHRQRELLSKAQSMAGLGCFEWDLKSNELTWSDTLCHIYGVDPKTFTPKVDTFLSMVHPEDREKLQRTFEEALANRSSFRNQERIIRPNGSVRHLESFAQVECDENGVPTHLIGACLDITDRKRMEQHLAESQKMEAVGRLAGGLAHDFNNLLTVINGNASLLEHSRLESEDDKEALQEISEAGRCAADLTSQLLAFSRGVPVEPSVIDFNEVVRDSLKWMQRLVGEGVTICLELEPVQFRLEIDLRQLEQLLMNLVVNARDAMPDGGVLRVRTRSVRSGNKLVSSENYVELSIQDTGSGIPGEAIPNIFEPFFTTKDTGRGTGLGLAVVHSVVTRWSGHIEVSSEPGAGTTFTIALPLTQKSLSGKAHFETTFQETGQETVLVVEDEDSVRRFVAKVLRAKGFQVLEAENPEVAMSLADNHFFDILLTDLVMPRIGGRELAESLRRLRPTLPVLFMSGYSNELNDLDIVGSGPVLFLNKPFSPQDLFARIQDLATTKTPGVLN